MSRPSSAPRGCSIPTREWTPYLHVSGPEKAIGKSLLMDVLAALAANPRIASGATPAALVHIVDRSEPTLFLDEMDAAMSGDKEMGQAVRGLLNAGFQRGGKVLKCEGRDNEVHEFRAFGPKCLAGIGNLWDTVASRSIQIEMRRKLRSETVERYRAKLVAKAAAPIRADLERWGAGVVDQLKTIELEPIEAVSDRANDIAEILLAITQLAGTNWLQNLTRALLVVCGSAAADDPSVGETLLADIRSIVSERGEAAIWRQPFQQWLESACVHRPRDFGGFNVLYCPSASGLTSRVERLVVVICPNTCWPKKASSRGTYAKPGWYPACYQQKIHWHVIASSKRRWNDAEISKHTSRKAAYC